jgi:hypothetical protein
MTTHFSEEQIQQYAENIQGADDATKQHIHECEICWAKATNYVILFSEIKTAKKPVFEFALSELMPREAILSRRSFPWLPVSIVLVVVLVMAVLLAFFHDYFVYLLDGISGIMLYLIIPVCVTLFAAQCAEHIENYRKKIKNLEFY